MREPFKTDLNAIRARARAHMADGAVTTAEKTREEEHADDIAILLGPLVSNHKPEAKRRNER